MHNAGRQDPLGGENQNGSHPKLIDLRAFGLCLLCTAPIETRFSKCFACGHAPANAIPDEATFLSYAMNGLQSGTVARQYKDAFNSPGGDPRSRQDMQILLYLCMAKHVDCLLRVHAFERLGVTFVPSGSGRKEHPLEQHLFPYVQGPPVIDIHRTAPSRLEGRRDAGIDPGRYEIPSDVTDAHILVLDDTWTTGTQMMSVVAALRAAGAARVTTLCIMRYLQREYPPTAGWLEEQGTLPKYSDDFCPVTRSFTCPR